MAIDVYHKVLHKLYELTGGKDSKAVDFKDLVKQLGFHGNYTDIFDRLSRESWIIETAKPDFVCITHWGTAEVKKSSASTIPDSNAETKREANKALAASRELSSLLENFAQSATEKDFPPIEKKFNELQNVIGQIKRNFA